MTLGIRPGMRVAVLHAPEGIDRILGELPDGVEVQHGLKRSDQVEVIVGFVTERAHLARNIGWLITTVSAGGVFWVVWPTRGSGVATDLTADAVREVALAHGWVGTATCDLDDTWSGLALAPRPVQADDRPTGSEA